MRRRRWRTIILVTGTTLCVLIAAAFVVSAWYQLAVQVPTAHGPSVSAAAGGMSFAWAQVWEQLFIVTPVQYPPRWDWWNHWDVSNGAVLFLPLYAVFLAVAAPTLLVWRFWRKPPKPGHCPCGYNLTGNVSGRCPECGQGIA